MGWGFILYRYILLFKRIKKLKMLVDLKKMKNAVEYNYTKTNMNIVHLAIK